MGVTDAVTKAYIRENEVFADAFNYFLHDGIRKIQPEQLRELDTTEIAILLAEKDAEDKKTTKPEIVQKYRDQFKSAAIMEDGKTAYILLGIESQTEPHMAMPVRTMLYDAIQYSQQVNTIAAQHRKLKDYRKQSISNGEFLSGFYKEEKLIPVITLVVFFNAGEWDGPRSLHEMMDISDPEVKKWVVDYPIYLISPRDIPDDDLGKFSSSLREVLGCIKYSEDKNKLVSFIRDNSRMEIDLSAARVIEAITHMKMEIEEGDRNMGSVNMCRALEEIMQDSKNEGIALGRSEGVDIGLIRGKMQVLSTLIQNGDISLQKAAAIMDMTPEEFIAKSKSIS